jgi:CTP:phosphocholine cytidylyltransferase-like protein
MKINNAVILAAGFSSRFVPICFDKPKGLLNVKGETLIERQIRQLKEVGIQDIYVVTGAYKEQFDFLREKHGVHLIFNPDFDTKNNFASFYAAKDVLDNTLISSADLYFPRNIFTSETEHPYYASVFIEGKTNQRCLTLDGADKIVATSYQGQNTWITFGGHAVLSKEICQKLIGYIEPIYNNPEFKNKYWVDFQDEHLAECPMYIKRLDIADIVEFNTLAALKKFDPGFKAVKQSETMAFICKNLSCSEEELRDFIPIKEENKAVGCSFLMKGKKYIYLKMSQTLEILP